MCNFHARWCVGKEYEAIASVRDFIADKLDFQEVARFHAIDQVYVVERIKTKINATKLISAY